MDRYEFPAMRRRCRWVIAAQFGLALSRLSLMLIESPSEQIGLLMLIIMLVFYRTDPGQASNTRHGPRRYTVGMADMQSVVHEGVDIDRCGVCRGIWFDAGELDALKDVDTARVIDVGDGEQGKRLNRADDYPCPRCSGEMLRVVDEQQKHIWFETCRDGNECFLDAGELRDLSKLTLSDFFKGLAAAKRT